MTSTGSISRDHETGGAKSVACRQPSALQCDNNNQQQNSWKSRVSHVIVDFWTISNRWNHKPQTWQKPTCQTTDKRDRTNMWNEKPTRHNCGDDRFEQGQTLDRQCYFLSTAWHPTRQWRHSSHHVTAVITSPGHQHLLDRTISILRWTASS